MSGYGSRCAVCELPLSALLVASHIVPWCVDKAERMNPQNGICLCVIHDRAFDKGLLLIGADYKISLHPLLWKSDGLDSIRITFKFDGSGIFLPDRWHPAPLLKRHAELVANLVTRWAAMYDANACRNLAARLRDCDLEQALAERAAGRLNRGIRV
jgi:hypothetical protein